MILATLCYIRQNGKTLMLYRNKKENDIHEGKWNGLGGKFQPGESPDDCVIREVKEESGLIIKKPRLHGIITFPKFDGKNDWYTFIYTANKYEGKIIDSREGELHWIDDDKVLDLNLWEGDKIFLKWVYEENKFFSAKFIYVNGKLKDYEVNFY